MALPEITWLSPNNFRSINNGYPLLAEEGHLDLAAVVAPESGVGDDGRAVFSCVVGVAGRPVVERRLVARRGLNERVLFPEVLEAKPCRQRTLIFEHLLHVVVLIHAHRLC